MIQVTGTANANPVSEVSEPTSPLNEVTTLVAGTNSTVQVGPYTNNSDIPLKITSATLSAETNCSANILASAFPVTVPAGGTTNLGISVTPLNSGPYSFDIAVTWST